MLEAFPETQVNIDLKDEEVRLVERVGEVITSRGAEGRSVPDHPHAFDSLDDLP